MKWHCMAGARRLLTCLAARAVPGLEAPCLSRLYELETHGNSLEQDLLSLSGVHHVGSSLGCDRVQPCSAMYVAQSRGDRDDLLEKACHYLILMLFFFTHSHDGFDVCSSIVDLTSSNL